MAKKSDWAYYRKKTPRVLKKGELATLYLLTKT